MVISGPRDGLLIVVGVHGTAASDAAVDWAAREARRRRASVHLVLACPFRGLRVRDATDARHSLAGPIPSEVWNRLGMKILPKLRSGSDLKVDVDFVTWLRRASIRAGGQLSGM